MKKIFTLILISLTVQLMLAQNQSVQSESGRYRFVHKNGNTLIGQIIEKKADGPYVIRLDNGAVIEMSTREIYRIRPIHSNAVHKIYSIPEYKWGFASEVMGVTNGFRNIGTPSYSTGLAVSAHRYITPSIAVGAGVGMYNYDLDARRLIIPIFAESKWRLVKQSSTPILSLKVGHGLAAKNYIFGLQDKKGGLFFNPFFGYELGTDRKIGVTIGIGVLLQKAYYTYANGSTFADEDIIFRRTEFKIGIAIH